MNMLEVSKAVIKNNGKYLLLKRAGHSKNYANLWDFPGGKQNKNETAKNSVVRETKEEVALTIVPREEVLNAPYKDSSHDLLFHFFAPTEL